MTHLWNKTIWITGLSGSGKSTMANALSNKLADKHAVKVLDGDVLRKGLNQDLGFSKEDRTENIRRTAEVAKLMNASGITVICALISPYGSDRQLAKRIIGSDKFIEIYISTPLSKCESRDPKGLYKKARSGEIQSFTGVSSNYEVPQQPNITIDTSEGSISECLSTIEQALSNLANTVND